MDFQQYLLALQARRKVFLLVFAAIVLFMWGGLKRELVPGRWQAAVEGLTGFCDNITRANIGPEGRKYLPWVFTAFVFILVCNWMGAMPFAILGAHPFTVTSQFSITGTMSSSGRWTMASNRAITA